MKKHLSIFFSIFCLLGLLFFSGCKTTETFNINGTWTLILTYSGWGTYVGTITFSGSETSGITIADFSGEGWVPGNGTYTVTDTNVTFSINWTAVSNTTNCTGTAPSDNSMNGSFTETEPYSGTWAATRL